MKKIVKITLYLLGIILCIGINYVLGDMLINLWLDTGKITDLAAFGLDAESINPSFLLSSVAIPYALCVAFLMFIGAIFNISYQAASVYVCIYIWQGLLLCSVLPILIRGIHNITKKTIKGYFTTILSIVYSTFYGLATYQLFHHYPLNDINYSFNLCVKDLQQLASYFSISYYEINIYIYIIGFVLLLLFNWLFFTVINLKRSSSQKFTTNMAK